MHRVRGVLVTIIIAAIAVRLMWEAIAPLIPYAIGALVTITVLGALYYRRLR
jgi:hypothetical protein